MTLDEAIKHCEEVAKKQEITARSNLIEIDKIKADGILRVYDADKYESCMKCASEHRQLAEWLKRLVIISNAKVEIIRRIEDTKSKDKLCEYPYIRCIDIVKEVFGDDTKHS